MTQQSPPTVELRKADFLNGLDLLVTALGHGEPHCRQVGEGVSPFLDVWVTTLKREIKYNDADLFFLVI